MNDNIIIFILSSVCFVSILIEWLYVSHRKSLQNMIVFLCYSLPLYYFLFFRGAGGAAFTWWFYLLILTSIHVIYLLFQILLSLIKRFK